MSQHVVMNVSEAMSIDDKEWKFLQRAQNSVSVYLGRAETITACFKAAVANCFAFFITVQAFCITTSSDKATSRHCATDQAYGAASSLIRCIARPIDGSRTSGAVRSFSLGLSSIAVTSANIGWCNSIG